MFFPRKQDKLHNHNSIKINIKIHLIFAVFEILNSNKELQTTEFLKLHIKVKNKGIVYICNETFELTEE